MDEQDCSPINEKIQQCGIYQSGISCYIHIILVDKNIDILILVKKKNNLPTSSSRNNVFFFFSNKY